MSEQVLKALVPPRLLDAFRSSNDGLLYTINCAKPGIVQSFNSTKRTAEVAVAFKRVLATGEITSIPVLVDCPVFTLQGGKAALTVPIVKGDECLLLFADRNIDAWYENGGQAAPYDNRAHDLSDGIALVGLNSLANPLPTPIVAGEAAFSFKDGTTSKVALKGGLVALKNDTKSFLTMMIAFITLLEGLTVQDGPDVRPLTAASIALLEAFKAEFQALFYA